MHFFWCCLCFPFFDLSYGSVEAFFLFDGRIGRFLFVYEDSMKRKDLPELFTRQMGNYFRSLQAEIAFLKMHFFFYCSRKKNSSTMIFSLMNKFTVKQTFPRIQISDELLTELWRCDLALRHTEFMLVFILSFL